MTKLLVLTLIALGSFAAGAATIYDQPDAAGGGYLSARYTVNGSGFDEFVWDSFSVTNSRTVREIQWRGTRTGAAPAEFQVSINTMALPGGTVWNITGTANETPTGTPGVYDYRFTLPAGFVLAAGQTYWLQVFATQNEMPNWLWSTGTGGNGTHYAQVPATTGNYRYTLTGGDVAFTLLDVATEPVTITLARSPAAGGTVTGGGTFAPGTDVTVYAAPASGRTFVSWTEEGVVVSTATNFTVTADGNKTLTANFSGANTGPYVISAVANPGVYGNVGGAGTFNAGEVVDLDVSAADGVSFLGWTENGQPVTLPSLGGGLFQITATEDRHLVANLGYLGYESFINGVVSPAYSGTVVISNTAGLSGKSFPGGTLITLTATPYSGYKFMYWKQGQGLGDLGGAPRIVSTNTVLHHMVCYGTSLIATFQLAFPVLTTVVSPAASGTVSGGGSYANGTTATVHATPAVGYVFSEWKVGSSVVSTDPDYPVTLTNHVTLTATFLATNRTVAASVEPPGAGSVEGAGEYGNGAAVTLAAVPSAGYVFSHWSLNGAPAGAVNPAEFDALGDYVFVANFEAVPAGAMPVLALSEGGLASGQDWLTLEWSSTFADWILQESDDLSTGSWSNSARTVESSGGIQHVTITPLTGHHFFRLAHP